MIKNLRLGLEDFLNSIFGTDKWVFLAFFDIRMKYRRSYLGPWWETLSAALIIGTLGYLWSQIFKVDMATYIPYFSIGFVLWLYISAQINESCEIFFLHQNIIVNIKIPYHSFLLRLALKNTVILFHSLLIIIPIIIYIFDFKIIFLFSLLGIFILFINITFLSTIIAIFCLRFHDIKYAVSNIVQITFFITPIVWMPGVLSGKIWLMEFNPIYHWINLIREPILLQTIPLHSLFFSFYSILFLAFFSFYILGRVKSRIPFWY